MMESDELLNRYDSIEKSKYYSVEDLNDIMVNNEISVLDFINGLKSDNIDIDVYEEDGGNALGWVIPGNPSGTEVYGGNTELKGTIPPGVPYADTYRWCNYKEGYIRNKIVGSNDWHYDANDLSWVLDFDTSYHWIDKDPKYPNSSGPDLREVFAQDGPCFIAHSTNDHKIAYPDNWRKVDFNRDYAACVVDKDTVIRISNWCYWNVYFVLEESSNHWSVVSHTP